MKKFTTLKGIPAYLPIVNVDTDMIIPKQFLKTIKRTGLGKNLFFEMRYDDNGKKIEDFILNKEPFNKSNILITGKNFGCGSSREHAPWALLDYGIKVVISSKIADIFKGNSLKNGLLPIVVTEDILSMLMDIPRPYLSICIEKSELTLPNKEIFQYEIDEFSKYCLIEGIDQLGYLKRNINLIEKFEEERLWTP